jgi:hypothetical protein
MDVVNVNFLNGRADPVPGVHPEGLVSGATECRDLQELEADALEVLEQLFLEASCDIALSSRRMSSVNRNQVDVYPKPRQYLGGQSRTTTVSRRDGVDYESPTYVGMCLTPWNPTRSRRMLGPSAFGKP